ncbi:site-specific integrase [Bradyrhizobium cosmicum]|uniref:tyrosine-type recombinase/integrase n=1 Tax=Bradyrhizobium cosmicum TaxID=1404864 RepID=UPI0028E78E48|nr:site-specific integrase [Bradyrhizobium cosmicum]
MKSISEKIVAALPVPATGNKKHFFSGATLQGKKAPSGFAVRVTAAGTKSFVLFHRINGKGYLETLGRWDENPQGGTLSVRDAIIKADKLAKDIKNGRREDARPERTRRLQDGDKPAGLKIGGAWKNGENKDEQAAPGLLDMFMERYVRKDAKGGAGLRSADQIESTFERLVFPEIGGLGIYDIRRSHIVAMLDEIADENGPVMADRTLAYIRKTFNWYALRDDQFNSPIVKGMARTNGKDRARKRTLADDEIRDLWAALERIEEPACYPAYIKTTLLCMSRRTEGAMMSSAELDGDVWTIPAERYKTGVDHVIPLSAAARELIAAMPAPEVRKNDYFIFSTTDGAVPFSGFSKAKVELDKALSAIRKEAGREPMENWTLHDLRRTGRSLMSRAKVDADHAERCMGHVIGGVRETYDRHLYLEEKREAFEALAAMVDSILNAPRSAAVAA